MIIIISMGTVKVKNSSGEGRGKAHQRAERCHGPYEPAKSPYKHGVRVRNLLADVLEEYRQQHRVEKDLQMISGDRKGINPARSRIQDA
jgi:hypothetical protein